MCIFFLLHVDLSSSSLLLLILCDRSIKLKLIFISPNTCYYFYNVSTFKLTSLWQLTDGKKFAQLIFSGDSLIDCEFIDDDDGNGIVSDFADKFIEEYHYIRHEKLSSTKHARHHQYHESANVDNEVIRMRPNVKFIQLKKLQEIPEHLLGHMNLRTLKKQCNQLHKEIRHRLLQTKRTKGIEEDLNAEIESTENTIRRYKT